MNKVKNFLSENFFRILLNLFLVYVCYAVCRLAFLFENWSILGDTLTSGSIWRIFLGGLRFDTSAIFYTNALVILLYLFPLHIKERRWYHIASKTIFVVVNALCVFINLADSVFFEYRRQRTTMAIFDEFGGEANLGGIIAGEVTAHWYLLLLFALMVWGLWYFYIFPRRISSLKSYYIGQTVGLIAFVPLAVCGMRGNTFFTATRPIAVSYAHRFVDEPIQTGLVLNTPFSMIRTVHQVVRPLTPRVSESRLDSLYSPVHRPDPADSVMRRKNVVILIVESFAQEFIGALNDTLDGGTYRGYTPFADSLLRQSLYFEKSFANGGFSIDAIPAVLASIPRLGRPFVLSPYSLNHINSLASELRSVGYSTAFFHGADNESLGFNAFVRQAGVERYFGKNEFVADPRFGGQKEFDGKWGIWDEPFLQYFCAELGELPQPFLATVFTLSSHHPFAVPEKYSDIFVDEGIHKLHKCIRYADYSLKRFFESAARQPWYENTIFVLSADHASSKRTHDVYKTDAGAFRIPILFFDPSGEMPRGKHEGIVQQTDIMPTILGYLGYNKPYVAFGKDVLSTPADRTWAFVWDYAPFYFYGDYIIRSDGREVTHIFNYVSDPLLQNNLKGRLPEGLEEDMSARFFAIIQSYVERMDADNIRIAAD